MEPINYIFRISPMDTNALMPQVSRALEKRTQLVSREQYPRLWKYTDKLGSLAQAPEPVMKRRRIRKRILSVICLALGIFLFVPGLMEPQELIGPLLMGAIAIGAGIGGLWQSRKKNKKKDTHKQNPFDRSAELLLKGRDNPLEHTLQASFSAEDMTLAAVGITSEGDNVPEKIIIPYSSFEYVIETDDILLLTYEENVAVLQKCDLVAGSIDDFRNFISERTTYISLRETEENND